jgi:micrococcal nuclease
VDGDTIRVRYVSGAIGRVRYIGIDTPERDAPCEQRATDANHRMVSGRRVRLVQDRDRRDRFGRLLAYVYAGDTFVNAELVRQGWATPLTIRPNVRFADRFERLADEARERGLGRWAGCR